MHWVVDQGFNDGFKFVLLKNRIHIIRTKILKCKNRANLQLSSVNNLFFNGWMEIANIIISYNDLRFSFEKNFSHAHFIKNQHLCYINN